MHVNHGGSYNPNTMSAQSFRDRYRNLSRLAGLDEPDPRVLGEEWPVPDGFQVVQSQLGEYAVRLIRRSGEHFAEARAVLEAAFGLSVDRQLYLDTETTGLSGGTGTYVFLVGIGKFDGDDFVVKQFFMRHPGEEYGMLLGLEREFEDIHSLVTFNGRSFDVPLLETRFRMHHRTIMAFDGHLDLLHPARAIWKYRLPSCSLSTLEHHLLGVRRTLDVPGWEIPAIFANYLRTKDPYPLAAVAAHNAEDITSLARLNALVAGYQTGHYEPDSLTDRLALALTRLRDEPKVESLSVVVDICLEPAAPATLRRKAIIDATMHGKRLDAWHLLERIWSQALHDASAGVRSVAVVELAKYYEHRVRDYHQALTIVEQAIDGARLLGDRRHLVDLQHRRTRLMRKVEGL